MGKIKQLALELEDAHRQGQLKKIRNIKAYWNYLIEQKRSITAAPYSIMQEYDSILDLDFTKDKRYN